VKPGDLIFFSKNGRGKISHVALVVDHDREGISVAHSTTSRGVIVENISNSRYWKPKIKFARDVISR
ncbi:MAG: NlpC/P60 family protein, partial [Bacteroidota bacterium]